MMVQYYPTSHHLIVSFRIQGSNNRDFLKITGDSDGAFPGPSHFWTDDGAVLPDFTSSNVDAPTLTVGFGLR